jgi:hypothetical protein
VRESRPPGSVRGALSNERPYRDTPIDQFTERKLGWGVRHKHEQSPVLVSSEALWFGLGFASRMAGLAVFLLMDVNCSLRFAFSDAGQQAVAVGFHSSNDHPFACCLLLERRTDRTAMEQWGRHVTTPGRLRPLSAAWKLNSMRPCRPASERPVATLAIGSALCDELIRGLQLNERRLDAS